MEYPSGCTKIALLSYSNSFGHRLQRAFIDLAVLVCFFKKYTFTNKPVLIYIFFWAFFYWLKTAYSIQGILT